MHDRMHARTRPLKLYYHESEQEIGLGWVKSCLLDGDFCTCLTKKIIDHVFLWALCYFQSKHAEIDPYFQFESATTMDQKEWRQFVYSRLPGILELFIAFLLLSQVHDLELSFSLWLILQELVDLTVFTGIDQSDLVSCINILRLLVKLLYTWYLPIHTPLNQSPHLPLM